MPRLRAVMRTLGQAHKILSRNAGARLEALESFAKRLIPDIVDSALGHLLGAIDQEVLRLLFTASNGKSVDLVAERLADSHSRMGKRRLAVGDLDIPHFAPRKVGSGSG